MYNNNALVKILVQNVNKMTHLTISLSSVLRLNLIIPSSSHKSWHSTNPNLVTQSQPKMVKMNIIRQLTQNRKPSQSQRKPRRRSDQHLVQTEGNNEQKETEKQKTVSKKQVSESGETGPLTTQQGPYWVFTEWAQMTG
ncbi:Hypothetical_protein [Hexamita inflata]|uniref:Hypothetical_protein n=1 Tax=Hexamita inflata TaxID=28002 RepID=A0AA86V6T3_9EUKA|nr:Hypothetical protein HINF_LOCUS66137 [Hexamita inflata]